MVHKKNVEKGFKAAKSLAQHKTTKKGFDLGKCQSIGPKRSDVRSFREF